MYSNNLVRHPICCVAVTLNHCVGQNDDIRNTKSSRRQTNSKLHYCVCMCVDHILCVC